MVLKNAYGSSIKEFNWLETSVWLNSKNNKKSEVSTCVGENYHMNGTNTVAEINNKLPLKMKNEGKIGIGNTQLLLSL